MRGRKTIEMRDREPPASVLVISLRYLGDTLLLRPVFRALRAALPQARLSALVTCGTGIALEGSPHIDDVIEWPRRSVMGEVRVLAGLFARSYDWAIDFTGNDRTALATLASRASLRVAYERKRLPRWALRRAAYNLRAPQKRHKPHTLVTRLELLEACGVPSQGTSIGLQPDPVASDRVQGMIAGLGGPRLHLHLTSRDMQKAIPTDVANFIAREAVQRGWSITATSGPGDAEQSHLARALEGTPGDRVRTFSKLSWQELVAMIDAADAYWGCDTAPAHIAAGLEKRMRVEFGPSNATHWAPLHAAGMAAVHDCPCREKGTPPCPAGQPGNCLRTLDSHAILEWLGQR